MSFRQLAARIKTALARKPEWEKRINAVDKSFDATHGVNTGGIIGLSRLTVVQGSKATGMRHVAVEPNIFEAAMSRLDIDHSRFSFIDLGSGKGRALYLARRYPFARVMGVEFARELHEAARTNVGHDPRVTLHCGDAGAFEFPPGPLVVYLYNPFDATIMQAVADRLMDSYLADQRDIFVMYLNPFQAQAWGRFEKVVSADLLEVYRASAKG